LSIAAISTHDGARQKRGCAKNINGQESSSPVKSGQGCPSPRRGGAFTLIELLVVIAIIALLAAFSFADGHSKLHKWVDARTTPPLSQSDLQQNIPSPNNKDVQWLQEHSTREY
jgi:prepilin-type N-terminal cleavage/methylation domain-containing protein